MALEEAAVSVTQVTDAGTQPETTQPETAEREDAGKLFSKAVQLMQTLRAPGGCPWDREQTPESIRKYTLEECYEVLDAIERKNPADLCEELGDLLLQVLFYAQMSRDAGEFSIAEVVEGLNRKLVRRHPHVFGEAASAAAGNRAGIIVGEGGISTGEVLRNWHGIKQFEKQQKAMPETWNEAKSQEMESRLSTVLRGQPALLEAAKLGSVAARSGFDWPDAAGLLRKLEEEAAEVEAEIESGSEAGKGTKEPAGAALRMELGDLLFTAAQLARHLGVDPEMALRDGSAKFRKRFAGMEELERGGRPLEQRSSDELEELWRRVKQREMADAGAARGDGTA